MKYCPDCCIHLQDDGDRHGRHYCVKYNVDLVFYGGCVGMEYVGRYERCEKCVEDKPDGFVASWVQPMIEKKRDEFVIKQELPAYDKPNFHPYVGISMSKEQAKELFKKFLELI